MTRLTWLAVGVVSALLAGCVSGVRTNPSATAVVAAPTPVSGRTIPDTMAAEVSAEAVRHFNFIVTVSGSGPTKAVQQAVEGRLAATGYKLNNDAPDIKVSLAVRANEFDRAGSYIRYEGTVESEVNRSINVWASIRFLSVASGAWDRMRPCATSSPILPRAQRTKS